MPWEYKALNGKEKGIMREAFKGLLPNEIANRKKTPFPKTFNPIFAEFVIKKADKLVNDKSSVLNEIVNKEFFNKLKDNSVTIDTPWYGQLMRMPQIFAYLIQLDTFFKTYNLNIT
ncbi:MAG: asparagine synthase-related protein, partial [Clostridia bacterium]